MFKVTAYNAKINRSIWTGEGTPAIANPQNDVYTI